MLTVALSAVTHLAEVSVTPVAPPGSERFLRLVGWASWFAMIAGVVGIIYGGGKFAWERMHGGAIESPKIIAGALIGGVFVTISGMLMNGVSS
ncbi:hypothetical protein ACQPXH_00275 [Nocardia sp. CA-135953]|uniref:hypothetical protein n=1 Tax=Nocardia sp. CA-135953 TaxID=3239978 RepID=UPI003D998B9E